MVQINAIALVWNNDTGRWAGFISYIANEKSGMRCSYALPDSTVDHWRYLQDKLAGRVTPHSYEVLKMFVRQVADALPDVITSKHIDEAVIKSFGELTRQQ